MPSLTLEDQRRLIGKVPGWICPYCKEEQYRNYCRQCDDFFFICKCEQTDVELHTGHRTY